MFLIIDKWFIAPILFPRGKRMGRKGRSVGSRPPRPPKVAPWASENPKYYPAVDTAAAIGAWTVGIQLPLSDADALTMGFGGRRRPDQVPIGVLNQAFSGFRRKSRTMSAKEKAKHFRGAIMRAFIA